MKINVFSKEQFTEYLASNQISDNTVEDSPEYFISILPTGGPSGSAIFKQNHRNTITLIFDDVLQDGMKSKWPIEEGYFNAKAMTVEQATQLAKFIKTIPNNSIVNIHCVEGKSRSVAIAGVMLNSPNGNPHVSALLTQALHDYN